MLKISKMDASKLSKIVSEFYEKGAMSPLMYLDYIRTALKGELSMVKFKEPKIIKIPKNIDKLLKGDFEPEYEIRIDEFPVIDDIPIWTGSTIKGMTIQIGLENGDSRFPCKVEFSDANVHGILAGATGMGKSVALESIIYGALVKYPPWELVLTLADAKIVSFKTFASLGLPHIENIAATSDVDYLVSVLNAKLQDMILFNSVFTNSGTGAAKLEDLRKLTGLCFPRNLMVIDEFQAMFQGADNKSRAMIQDILDRIGRLGRNSGYHMLLASQELSGDVKPIMGNVKVRMALGCGPNVSNQILNNPEASKLKQKGRLIMNLNPFEDKNIDDNVEFRVPYLDPEVGKPFLNSNLKKLGEDMKFRYPLNFYDEYDVVFEENYSDYLKRYPKNSNIIYLGEPCFYTKSEEKIFKIEFRGKPLENIIILHNSERELVRYIKMIKHNVKMHPEIKHRIMYTDEDIYNESLLKELDPNATNIRDTTHPMYNGTINNIYIRMLIHEIDELVFSNPTTDEESDIEFQRIIEKYPNFNTETNKIRAYYFYRLMKSPVKEAQFGITRLTGDEKKRKLSDFIVIVLNTCTVLGYGDKQLTRKDFPQTWVWLLGIDKLLGIGRDVKSQVQDILKKACQDAGLVNIKLVLVTPTTAEMGFLKEAGRYIITGVIKDKDVRGIGAQDAYPRLIGNPLGVLYDKEKDLCQKFKKMYFSGEIVV